MSQTLEVLCETCRTRLRVGQKGPTEEGSPPTKRNASRPWALYDMRGRRSLHNFIDDHMEHDVRFVVADATGVDIVGYRDEAD